MKLRYYLRGLGIGILVTALILTIVPGEKEVLSDAEIRERALQLGMVYASSMTLADMRAEADVSKNKEQSAQGESADIEAVVQEGEEAQASGESSAQESEAVQAGGENSVQESEAAQASGESSAQESEAVQTGGESSAQESEAVQAGTEATSEYVTITIKSGDGSYTVAKALEAAGLIADAKAFDTYLCDNGYSRTIGTGTYKIAFDSTEEEIAKIISRKR